MMSDLETLKRNRFSSARMHELNPAQLGIRKKVRLFHARENDGSISGVIALTQKSRVVLKDVAVLEQIIEKMAFYSQSIHNRKVLIIEAPLCSKARNALEDEGWDIV